MRTFPLSRMLRLTLAMLLLASTVGAQVTTTGRLTGVVTDATGALVPKAEIVAVNDQTKAELKATANDEGSWTIASVPNGVYTVSVTAPNFKTTVIKDVKIDAGLPTTLNPTLEPGGANEQVVITGGAEILQTETSNVATTITGRQIGELPFSTRDALQLVLTLPGVQTPGAPRTSSVNGLPKGSVNITLDGANIQDNFLRSSDGFFTSIQPKSDAVQEVTVSTAVPGAESGGEGAVQIKFVTKNGTSEFHGGGFWQYRSPRFNSNYYFNNIDGLPRDRLFLRQYGGHVGGPILIPHLLKSRDKLFFFVNHEEFHLDQSYASLSATGNILVLTDAARNGVFTYKDASGNVQTINLYTLAASKGFPSTPDPIVAQGLNLAAEAVRRGGALRSRTVSANDYNRLDYQFQDPGNNLRRFPTGRLDWNVTKNQHFEFIHNYQHYLSTPDAVNGQLNVYPGSGVVVGSPGIVGSIHRNTFNFVGAHRWTINSRLVNEARFTSSGNGTSLFTPEFSPGLFQLFRGYALNTTSFLGPQGIGGGAFYNRRSQSRRNTPTRGLNDNLTYTLGTHTLNFGLAFLRIRSFTEAVSTQVVPRVNLGLATGDPVNTGSTSIFTTANFPGANSTQLSNARSLYAILTGRVSSINRVASLNGETQRYEFAPFREYNHQNELSYYVQDSWKARPNLTFNYGLRWEWEPSPINENRVYTRTGYEGVFGVSGLGNLFRPGVYEGTPTQFRLLGQGEKAFRTRSHDLAPSFGFSYTPDFKTGALGRLLGGGHTVLRGGYSIAYTREGFNAFNAMFGSNEGPTVTLDVSPSITPSIFPAGSVLFRNSMFPSLTPPSDTSRFPFTPVANSSSGANDFNSNIKAGYTQSYSVGVQRELTKDTVVEARYVSTHGTHLWRQYDINEVNIFENGFLNAFRQAQQNLVSFIAANPRCGQSGQVACNYGTVPLITTAIGSSTDQTTIQFLQQGQAGALANSIANNRTRMNNLINAGLIPSITLPPSVCTVTAAENCKVSNFFVANPQTLGGAFLMTNGIDTNFNALQIELRRRLSRGLLVQGSYQFGKALSNNYTSSSSVFAQPRTLRDLRQDRSYSPWDIRHSFKLDYLYELPFGPGRRFATSGNPFVSRVVGDWQMGGVIRLQSGSPALVTSGGRATFNQYDAGVVLHNITLQQLQSMVKIRKTPNGLVYWLPDSIIQNTLAAFDNGGTLDPNAPYIGPPTTPGELGQRVVLFGPSQMRFDFNVVKRIRLTEKTNVEGRVQFLNAFNRANFFIGGDADNTIRSISAGSTSFGQTRSAYRDITVSGTNDPGGRLIEFQLRFNF